VLGGSAHSNPFRYLVEEGQAAVDHHRTHRGDLHGHLPLADWLTASLRGAIDESAAQRAGLEQLGFVTVPES
jgi:biopolymer transport protein ExbB